MGCGSSTDHSDDGTVGHRRDDAPKGPASVEEKYAVTIAITAADNGNNNSPSTRKISAPFPNGGLGSPSDAGSFGSAEGKTYRQRYGTSRGSYSPSVGARWKDPFMMPLMAAEERQEILAILAQTFAPPRQILSTLGRIKSSMRRWVQTARARIKDRKEGSSPKHGSTTGSPKGAPKELSSPFVPPKEGFEEVPQADEALELPAALGNGGGNAELQSHDPLDDDNAPMPLRINTRASISASGTMSADAFEGTKIPEDIAAQLTRRDSRNDAITAISQLLDQRLTFLGLFQVRMPDDGNSQFRAIALQVLGDAEEHQRVRKTIVSEMWRQRESDYDFLFESPEECESYLTLMSEDGTLGDELTLRAACDVYGCVIHIITSEPGDQYYLKYVPTLSKLDEGGLTIEVLDVFVALAMPVHFNAVLRHSPPADL